MRSQTGLIFLQHGVQRSSKNKGFAFAFLIKHEVNEVGTKIISAHTGTCHLSQYARPSLSEFDISRLTTQCRIEKGD